MEPGGNWGIKNIVQGKPGNTDHSRNEGMSEGHTVKQKKQWPTVLKAMGDYKKKGLEWNPKTEVNYSEKHAYGWFKKKWRQIWFFQQNLESGENVLKFIFSQSW